MMRPLHIISPKPQQATNWFWLWEFTPKEMRNFCVLVIAEGSRSICCGAGTLTEKGVVTASHIFWFGWEKIWVVLYRRSIIPASYISFQDNENDIAVLEVPLVSVPKVLPKMQIPIPEKERKYYAFGCPKGIFGQSWEPNLIGETKFLISQGVVIPGISGGGLFAKTKSGWYLLAVHSYGFIENQTLYSIKI